MINAGIFVLNKPEGMTSQQAVTRVKRALGYQKAGHSGTLDPGVTGVLPVFLGAATRLTQYISEGWKSYEATLSIGTATDTQDASGTIVERGDASSVSEADVRSAIFSFAGVHLQTPPAYSAKKVDGVRSYDLARRGVAVPLTPREVSLRDIVVHDVSRQGAELTARFSVACSKGTYIRTLCVDIGRRLGLPAHMAQLTRTASGPFTLSDAHPMPDGLSDGQRWILPAERAVPGLMPVHVTHEQWLRVTHGASIECSREQVPEGAGDLVRVHRPDGQMVAIYQVYGELAQGTILRAVKVLEGA